MLFVWITGAYAFGQQQITGQVTDSETGEPIPGVTVVVKGQPTIGTSTDIDGNYSLSVPSDAQILVFSFVGKTTREVPIEGRTTINIQLEEAALEMEEVVVVGYGSQSKKLITGSVESIETEDIEDEPLSGVDQALQGRMAGVRVMQNSGTPGGGISVRIRGSSSINASNQPLYIVDGVPINIGDYTQQTTFDQDLNATSSINPNDIESIEVLKDASYASIYGARAANGVVLITTKKGEKGATQFDFNYSTGTQEMANKRDLLNSRQYVEAMNEALFNSFGLEEYLGSPDDVEYDTDWQDEVTREAPINEYQLSMKGGNDDIKYYISGGYIDQKGIVIGSAYEKLTARINSDIKGSERLTLGTRIQLSNEKNSRIWGDNNIFAPLANAFAVEPTQPVYNEDGSYNENTLYPNPVAMGKEPEHMVRTFRTIGNLFGEYEFFTGLNFKTSVNADIMSLREDSFLPTDIGIARGSNGDGTSGNSNIYRVGIENTLTYDFAIGRHNFSALGGFSYEHNNEFYSLVQAINFPSNDFKWITSAAEIDGGSSSTTTNKLASYFGRVQYDFNRKYLAQFSLRADGSSRFGADNRYGTFPAASLAWRVSEEDFLQGNPVISELKIRASYGTTGNQEIANFGSLGLWGSDFNYLGNPAVAPSQLANPKLRWEKTTTLEGGINIGLFDDRIDLTASYYDKETDDLLLPRPLPSTSGYTSIIENIGKSRNRGLELSLNTINLNMSNGLQWTTNFNIAFNKSEIVKLYRGEPIDVGFVNRYAEGEPFGAFYGLEFTGVDPQTGDMQFKDLNDDGVINDDDRTFIGNPNPKYEGGLSNALSFKGVELRAFFQFVQGNDVYNGVRTYSEAYFFDNMETRVLDRWQQPGDQTDVPRAVYANPDVQRESSYKVEDGSFIRLKSLTLSYRLPGKLLDKIGMRNVRIYATGQNLITWTDYSGPDPEVNYAGTSNTIIGTDFYTYPIARTWTFGVNIGL